MAGELHVVTGAFGYSGQRIAERLLEAGERVRTLTDSPSRSSPLRGRIEVHAFNFDRSKRLEEALRGAAVLYNTYWVRFNQRRPRSFRFARAVENTRELFAAAKRAGVGRVVHVSIANASPDSPFDYFRGKAKLEKELRDSGLAHTILRPALLFGGDDVLINNLAWLLRRFPAVPVFGDGQYRVQPIHVDDLAALAVEEGRARENRTLDAVGPETYTFVGLMEELSRALGVRRLLVPVPPALGLASAWLLGKLLRDVVVTRDEVAGLMQELLYTGAKPTGSIRLSEWARTHAATLGLRWSSELGRRRDRRRAYRDVR
jgi:NADH dehydrogenase